MSDMYLDGVRVKPMSEPITREEIAAAHWFIVKGQFTVDSAFVSRLLAALEAGDALADRIAYVHEWLETVGQRATGGYFGLDHALGQNPTCSLCAVHAGWRARVEATP